MYGVEHGILNIERKNRKIFSLVKVKQHVIEHSSVPTAEQNLWLHDNDVSTSKLNQQENEIIRNSLRLGIGTKKETKPVLVWWKLEEYYNT
ncbi:hypothetical protein MTR_5g081237 [Medicago truncatula]|uniref:Uncharacterized protein n=1 Tax=Medicago truncatula TaxID=3880 RepID=A0A072UGJ7_MEDTR|nr:hypothetical protein MTR_5g081237 [Medicago truncatula]